MIFGALSFRGGGGPSLALVCNIRVKTQMPIAPEHAFKEKSTKFLILPSLRTFYNRIFQCETPCNKYTINTWFGKVRVQINRRIGYNPTLGGRNSGIAYPKIGIRTCSVIPKVSDKEILIVHSINLKSSEANGVNFFLKEHYNIIIKCSFHFISVTLFFRIFVT